MKTKKEIIDKYKYLRNSALEVEKGIEAKYSIKAEVAGEMLDEYASQFQQEWIPVEEETAREPIQDALYATGRFTKDECDVLSDGILRYINDANLVITPQPYNPTKS